MSGGYKRYERMWLIFVQDILISLLASLLAILLLRWLTNPIAGFSSQVFSWLLFSLAGIFLGEIVIRPYRDVRRFATVRSMGKTLLTVLIKEALLLLILLFAFFPIPTPYAALLLFADLLFTVALVFYVRMSVRLLLRHSKTDLKAKAQRKTALVVGTDEPSLLLASDLEKEGYSVLGLVTRDPDMAGRVISDYQVYLCEDPDQLNRLQWMLGGIDSLHFPKQEVGLSSGTQGDDSIPQVDGMSLAGHILKRSFDIGLSGVLLIIFSPVIGLCAWAIKREDGGPVFYAQERIGKGGKPFYIYKFRSMGVNAEQNGRPALYSGEDDPRLTRVGRFLRAHHLDELPQLWNVFKGDMSFIGYRPERQFFIDQIMACNARYRYLYQIRPGVTSYATLYNGYTDTLEKMLTRLDLDLYYLRNHSVWFDLKVLGLTFLSIVSGKKF